MNQWKFSWFVILGFIVITSKTVDAHDVGSARRRSFLLGSSSSAPLNTEDSRRRARSLVHITREDPKRGQAQDPRPRYSSSSRADKELVPTEIRGGSGFVPGDNVLSFSENLSGSAFSFLSMLHGIACGIDPRGSALVLYGYDKQKMSETDQASVKFLMRIIGSIMTGIGLTAAFSVASQLRVLGNITPRTNLYRAIGIGMIPRTLLALRYTFFKDTSEADRIRILDRKGVWFGSLVETVVAMVSLFTGRLVRPGVVIACEVAASLAVGMYLFHQPSELFKASAVPTPPTKHERLLTRLAATYGVMNAVLIASLHYPPINALPATGLTALTWALGVSYITFGSNDIRACDCSMFAAISVIAGNLAVAVCAIKDYIKL